VGHNACRFKRPNMREDFPDAIKNEIAQRAMYICAECLCLTGYGTSEGKARKIAEAAHVNAASKKGPRAKRGLTSTYLKSAGNGIWLCRVCHKMADDDPVRFDEARLKQMKSDHEEIIRHIVGK